MTRSYTPTQIADGLLAGEFTRDSAFVPLAEVALLLLESEVLAKHEGSPGREWHSGGAWLYPGDTISVVRAALEAKP